MVLCRRFLLLLPLALALSCQHANAKTEFGTLIYNNLQTHGTHLGGRRLLRALSKVQGGPEITATSASSGRTLHAAKSPQTFRVRRGAAVLSKVTNCPGIKPSDVAKLVSKTRLTARIGAIPKPPTPQAAKFAGQTITMYIAPKTLDAKKQQEVLGPIARGLSKLAYCPFQGDHVLNLEVTLLSVELLGRRQLTATDKKIVGCLKKIKVSMRAGHIEKIDTAAAAKAGTLVVPYVVAA